MNRVSKCIRTCLIAVSDLVMFGFFAVLCLFLFVTLFLHYITEFDGDLSFQIRLMVLILPVRIHGGIGLTFLPTSIYVRQFAAHVLPMSCGAPFLPSVFPKSFCLKFPNYILLIMVVKWDSNHEPARLFFRNVNRIVS